MDRARASARDLARDLDEPGIDAVFDMELARARSSAVSLGRNPDLARDLARDIDLARDLDLVNVLDNALDWVNRINASDLARVLDHAVAPARDLATALNDVRELISVNAEAPRTRVRRQPRVTPAARRLLTVAARLLPPVDRARYAAEFRAELWDLAQAGAPRRAQLAYASRQVGSAMRLRTALRAPARHRAVP